MTREYTIKQTIIDLIEDVLYNGKDDDANIWLLMYCENSLGYHPHSAEEAYEFARQIIKEVNDNG